jgi:hypothetical protein
MKKNIHLNDMKKELPFRVPDNYFDDLPDRVMERCQEEGLETSKEKRSILFILKPAFSLAAMFIGFAVIAYLAISLVKQPDDKSYHPNDIAKANYEEQFKSEQEILDAIEREETMDTENEKNEYIDYLLNEDIDYGTLIKELKEKEQDTSNK